MRRGEGSTSWLNEFAGRTGRDFFSIDFAPEGYENARRACGPCAHRALGEDFLRNEFLQVSKFGKISFAYLDNYDWIWAGEHPESYKPSFPEMIADHEMSEYKLKMRKEYEAEGFLSGHESLSITFNEDTCLLSKLIFSVGISGKNILSPKNIHGPPSKSNIPIVFTSFSVPLHLKKLLTPNKL